MITQYYGVMGSGKSVYAVNRIYNNFSPDKDAKKEKKVTFKNCYTNIVEFKFDKVENVYKFDFDDFYKILVKLYGLFKEKADDTTLLNICTELNIKDTLFVIDESQNHFDVDDKILVWWLTYHRHLNHEIMLIAPDASLIHLKYRKLAELTYIAKSRLLVLDKRYFKYNVYCSYKITKATHNGSIKIKSNPKVFELYKSGDSIDGENIVLKFIIIVFFILLFIFAIMYYFFQGHSSPSSSVPTSQAVNNSVAPTSQTFIKTSQGAPLLISNDYKDSVFLELSCSNKVCINKEVSLPPQLLRIFIDKKDIEIIYKEVVNKNNTVFYLNCKNDLYNFIKVKKENKYAENDNKLSIFGSTASSK